MNIKSADIYLNTLCLAAYAPGPTSKKFVDAVIQMYDESANEEKTLMNGANSLYVKILRDISSGDLDLSNKSEIAGLMLKFADDPVAKADSAKFQDLQRLLSNTEPVSDARIKTLVKKVDAAVAAGDKALAAEALKNAVIALDKAGAKGVFHKNTIARKVSQLTKAVNAMA